MVFRAIAVGVALSGGSNYGEFVANLWRIYGDGGPIMASLWRVCGEFTAMFAVIQN
jgi:hypothetical protein